jgi:hypothetical protein
VSAAERDTMRIQIEQAAVKAFCPRTSLVLDAAWDRLNLELDEGARARLSDFIFVLGVCQSSLKEMTQEEAEQAFAILSGDLR